jgi:hypothetical protein
MNDGQPDIRELAHEAEERRERRSDLHGDRSPEPDSVSGEELNALIREVNPG